MAVFQQTTEKPIPNSVLIFGAADHIGGPLASFLCREAPEIKLRLATRNEKKAHILRESFPSAEVVIADYYDLVSLSAAVAGMEGLFVITPADTNEHQAMSNMVEACRASGTLVHMVRFMGQQPEANVARIPEPFRSIHYGGYDIAIQKHILDHSGLPITYVNSGATFMDNFFRLGLGETVRRERRLVWPERLIPWIDPRDIAEAVARLLLSPNHRHIGQFHTMNNGHDLLRFHEVAELLGEVLGEPVSYDSSPEAFRQTYAFMGEKALGIIAAFFAYEESNEVVWARNDFVERMIGRKPKTLREWLIEHREYFLAK